MMRMIVLWLRLPVLRVRSETVSTVGRPGLSRPCLARLPLAQPTK